jgi:hypothetical protein
MDWIAISVTIGGDPAVHRMAAVLKVRVAEIVGLLALTFAGMGQHAPTGQIAAVPDSLLEQWSTWHGKRGAFAAQFRAELCDDTGLVRAWEKYNGANIRRLGAARERARVWRETKERTTTVREPNANGTHTRTHTKRAAYASTGQDSTEQNYKSKSSPPSWTADGALLWTGLVGSMTPGRFGKALTAIVALHGWPAVRPDLQKWVAERKRAGKPCRVEYYASDASARITAPPPPAIVDEHGCLTEYGERITRPDTVSA